MSQDNASLCWGGGGRKFVWLDVLFEVCSPAKALAKRSRRLRFWVYLRLRLARPCVHLR